MEQTAEYGVVVIDAKTIFQAAHKETDLNGPYHALIGRVFSLQATVEAVTKEINANSIEAVTTEHEAARVAARAARTEYDTAKLQELRYRNAELQAENEHSKAIRNYANLKNNPPHPNTYPSKEEIAAWEKAVADAKTSADAAHEKVVEAGRDSTLYYGGLRQLTETFNAAAKKEGELRKKLNTLKGISESGQSERHSEFGFVGA